LNDEPLATRDQLHAYLVQKGFPFGLSLFDKLGAPNCDPTLKERYKGGPPIEAYLPGPGRGGVRPMYKPSRGLNWARSNKSGSCLNLNTAGIEQAKELRCYGKGGRAGEPGRRGRWKTKSVRSDYLLPSRPKRK
jgi:hypothetical protein